MISDQRPAPNGKLKAKSYKLQAGFTLIEVILYLGIVSLLLTSISYLMIDIMSGRTSSRADQEVNYNIRLVSDQLVKDIAAARGITSLTNSALDLDAPGNHIIYQFNPSNATLSRQVGSAASTVVNTGQVDVSGGFTDLSAVGRSNQVEVHLTVIYKNPSNRIDYQASSTVDFSAELRGRR